MKHIRLLTFMCLLFGTLGLNAQLKLSGEFRPRGEYSHGYKSLAADNQHASFFVSQRTRLNLDFHKEKLKTGLVLQDVRLWGSQPQLVGNEDKAASIHAAWLRYQITPLLAIKAGRQELVYDNSRILGNVGWAQQGRSHDLLLFKFEGRVSVHAGVAYNEDSDRSNNFYFGPDAYKTMQFLWADHETERLKLSLLFLNNGIPNPKDTIGLGNIADQSIAFSQTIGPVISYNTDLLGINLEAYYQRGKNASDTKLSALYGKAEAVLKLSKFNVCAGYEYLSGNAWDNVGTDRAFTPFYGTNHKFNGFMDYFYVGNHENNVGLQDIYLKAKTSIGAFALNADVHIFSSAAEMSAGADSYLGTEVDLVCSWKVDEQLNISSGYSQMLPGASMEALKGGSQDAYQNWAWLMLTVKPVFLQTGD